MLLTVVTPSHSFHTSHLVTAVVSIYDMGPLISRHVTSRQLFVVVVVFYCKTFVCVFPCFAAVINSNSLCILKVALVCCLCRVSVRRETRNEHEVRNRVTGLLARCFVVEWSGVVVVVASSCCIFALNSH